MCGRFTLIEEFKKIQEYFETDNIVSFKANFNITPSQEIPIVRRHDHGREMALCHWGLVPHWSKSSPKFKPINARAETITDKPFFRDCFRHRRCLIPSSGYYEWKKEKTAKQPYFIRVKDAPVFAFAGLWDNWDHDGHAMQSCTIITTTAAEEISQLHDRMPVIIDPGNFADWLNEGGTGLLTPFEGEMEFYAVSKAVNSPKNNDPALIKRV